MRMSGLYNLQMFNGEVVRAHAPCRQARGRAEYQPRAGGTRRTRRRPSSAPRRSRMRPMCVAGGLGIRDRARRGESRRRQTRPNRSGLSTRAGVSRPASRSAAPSGGSCGRSARGRSNRRDPVAVPRLGRPSVAPCRDSRAHSARRRATTRPGGPSPRSPSSGCPRVFFVMVEYSRSDRRGDGSCRSRGRKERAHRSLENAQNAFPTAPTAHHHLALEREVTARLCHMGDREAVSLRQRALCVSQADAVGPAKTRSREAVPAAARSS